MSPVHSLPGPSTRAARPEPTARTALPAPRADRAGRPPRAVGRPAAGTPAEVGASRLLVDSFGRVARDLRVSLTDRCNLRCTYCMPEEGMEWLQRDSVLSDDEVMRLVALGVTRLGLREVRFTGGEPLMRRGLEGIVARTAALRTDQGRAPDISLTTNALGLDKRARALRDAGLTRVNISLDSVDADTYRRLSRRDRFRDVVAGIDAAQDAGLSPVKINAVAMRGLNDAGLPDLLDFCLDRGLELRIIEEMPLGADGAWRMDGLLGQDEILALLARDHDLAPDARAAAADPSAPARLWDVAPSPRHPGGRVGIIASMTDPFCSACDRTRLTADGQMRPCLFGDLEIDLRGLMRSGASDEDLLDAWAGGMAVKRRAHGRDRGGPAQPLRRMSAIGG